jgi:hypothetical protein
MKRIAVLVAGFLIVALCIGIVHARDEDQTKIIFVTLTINQGVVSEKSVEIGYGHAPNLGHQKGNFTATARAYDGTPLFTFDIWDPRSQFEDHEVIQQNGSCDITGSMWHTDNIELPLILPYDRDIRTLDLIEKGTGILLVSVNISPASESFNQKFPMDRNEDPDTIPEDDTPAVMLITMSVLAVILVAVLIRLVRRS